MWFHMEMSGKLLILITSINNWWQLQVAYYVVRTRHLFIIIYKTLLIFTTIYPRIRADDSTLNLRLQAQGAHSTQRGAGNAQCPCWRASPGQGSLSTRGAAGTGWSSSFTFRSCHSLRSQRLHQWKFVSFREGPILAWSQTPGSYYVSVWWLKAQRKLPRAQLSPMGKGWDRGEANRAVSTGFCKAPLWVYYVKDGLSHDVTIFLSRTVIKNSPHSKLWDLQHRFPTSRG